MSKGLGTELYAICPTWEPTRVGTLFITSWVYGPDAGDLVASGSLALTNMETGDWTVDTDSGGIRALTFGGTDEYISGPAAADLESIGACSLSFWFQRSSTANIAAFGKFNGNTRLGIQIWNDSPTPKAYFWVGDSTYGEVAYSGTGWHHAVLIFDGSLSGNSNRLKAYIDGVAQTLTFTGAIPATTPAAGIGSLLIGRAGSGYATGMFDDARAWATAISAANVVTLYTARGIQVNDENLDSGTLQFEADAGLTNPWLFPENPRLSIVDWYRFASQATESTYDAGRYTATVDLTWNKWRLYDITTRGRRSDVLPGEISVERPVVNRVVKTRTPSTNWTPDALTNGCYCLDVKPGFVYTDALGTVLAEVGDSCLSMRCRYTNLLVPFSGAMTLERDGWGGYQLDTNGAYMTFTGHTLNNSECFMSFGFKLTSAGTRQLIGTQSSGAQRWYFAANSSVQFTGTANAGSYTTNYTNSEVLDNVWSAHYSAGAANIYAGYHITTGTTSSGGTSSFFNDNLYILKYAGDAATDGKFCSCVIAKGSTTADERERVIKWNGQQCNSLLLAFVGNSLTRGTGSTGNATGFPEVALPSAQAIYGSGISSRYKNTGYPGAPDTDVYEAITGANEVDHGSSRNLGAMCGCGIKVATLWGVTNSIGSEDYSDDVTPRAAVDSLWQSARKLKQWGFKIILITCIDRQNTTVSPFFSAAAATANQLMEEEYSEYVDYIIPLHTFSGFTDALDTTYFNVDKVHLSDAGYEAIAPYYLRGLESCMESLPEWTYDAKAKETKTIMNRIGSFSGSGINNILGFLKAIMRKDVVTPSDVGGTYDDATDSLEAQEVRGGIITSYSPVSQTGDIRTAIVIGDDYLAANDRAFTWTIAEIQGYTVGATTCKFGGAYKTYEWLVTGTVTDNGDNTWELSFDLDRTDTTGLVPGAYEWSVEVIHAGTEITPVYSNKRVNLINKHT